MTRVRRIFNPILASGADTSAPTFLLTKIGDVDTTTVEVQFGEVVQAADFTAGVTIKVNTVAQVIASGTLQPGGLAVYYVIPACDVNDTVTWEYASGSGNIQDAAGNALEDVSAQTAVNYIGSQFWFDDLNSSGHFAHI